MKEVTLKTCFFTENLKKNFKPQKFREESFKGFFENFFKTFFFTSVRRLVPKKPKLAEKSFKSFF